MSAPEQLAPGPQATGQLEKRCLGFCHAYIQEETEAKAEVKQSHLRHRLYCVTPQCGPEHFTQCQFAQPPKAAEFCGCIIYCSRSEEFPTEQAVLSNDPKQQLMKVVGTPEKHLNADRKENLRKNPAPKDDKSLCKSYDSWWYIHYPSFTLL